MGEGLDGEPKPAIRTVWAYSLHGELLKITVFVKIGRNRSTLPLAGRALEKESWVSSRMD